jgi:hypothetical protein
LKPPFHAQRRARRRPPAAGLLAAAGLTLLVACRPGPQRVAAESELYDGEPPPSFVLRKFALDEPPGRAPAPPDPRLAGIRPCAEGAFKLNELACKTIALSNQDIDSALNVLAAMGYQIIVANSGTTPEEQASPRAVFGRALDAVPEYTCDDLPVVMLSYENDDEGFSFAPGRGDDEALDTMGPSHSGDVDRLIVFYHPAEPEKLANLEGLMHGVVDVPAAQVYIEGWVLEILEEDSKELGLRYRDSISDDGELFLGSESVDGGSEVVDLVRDKTGALMPDIGVRWKVRALVENGKAEILSRPSLLALSNRQAVIQILDVVQYPVQESAVSELGGQILTSSNFESISIGITLNLRPRVSADRKWVSLELDAVVETEDEENSGEAIFVQNGEAFVTAIKPGTSRKRVRTFARIPDRTPIIVGGLVSKERSTLKSRLPGVGSLPGVGALFGATDWDVKQREIMIILTPYVLAEDAIGVAANTPKESFRFDEGDMRLFEDRYRLRAEDLFDLSSLTRSSRFLNYLYLVEREARLRPRRSLPAHYTAFLDGNFPGGEALVGRTFFDLVEKLGLAKDLSLDALRVRLRTQDRLSNTSLRAALAAAGDAPLYLRADESGSLSVYAEPTEGAQSVALASRADVKRFVKAAVAREMIRLNGGQAGIKIRDLKVGMFVTLPSLGPGEELTVDLETLRTFESVQSYEKVVYTSLQEAFRRIDADEAAR